MEQEREELLKNIEETKASLGDKLGLLENQVLEKVESAKSTVEGAIHSVSSSVHDTADAMKRAFNPAYQTRQHPWVMVGGSIAAGVIAGSWAGANFLEPRRSFESEMDSELQSPGRLSGQTAAIRANRRPSGPSPIGRFFSSLTERFDDEIHMVTGMVVGSLINKVAEKSKEAFPNFSAQIDEIAGSAAGKFGASSPSAGSAPSTGTDPEHSYRVANADTR